MTKDDLVLFLDNVGRTVIGELVSENKTTLEVKNPSVLHVVPNQENGQIQVQLIPVFFKEFSTGDGGTWSYLKANVTRATGVSVDDRLHTQYNNMYSVIQAPGGQPAMAGAAAGAPAGDAPVVKLFDD